MDTLKEGSTNELETEKNPVITEINNTSNDQQLMPFEKNTKIFNTVSSEKFKLITLNSTPENSFKNFSTTFKNSSHFVDNSLKSPVQLLQNPANKSTEYSASKLDSALDFESKTTNDKNFNNTELTLLQCYLRKKNSKNITHTSSIDKKLKKRPKLKREIFSLLNSEAEASSITEPASEESKTLKGAEEKKLFINELNIKEHFLSDNINRNILALEHFINSRKNSTTSDHDTNCHKLILK